MIAETWRRRPLVLSFVRRQYQLRYRQSFAGFAWAVFPPIASLVVATVVFHEVIGVDTGTVSYPLFALAGLAPWSFFASSVSAGVPSIVMQQSMVTRLAFPRAAIPISAVGTALLDLGMTTVVFVAFATLSGAGLPLTALWAPLLLLIEIVFVVGVVLFGSALNVFARDIRLRGAADPASHVRPRLDRRACGPRLLRPGRVRGGPARQRGAAVSEAAAADARPA